MPEWLWWKRLGIFLGIGNDTLTFVLYTPCNRSATSSCFARSFKIKVTQKRKEEIIREFVQNDLILTTHGFERIISHNLEIDGIIKVAKERDLWLVSDEFLTEFVEEKEKEEVLEKIPETAKREAEEVKVVVERGKHILAKEIEPELEIFKETDVTGRSTCEGKLEDFVEYFNEKYRNLREIIRNREGYPGAIPIDALKRYKGEDLRIIAMVKDKRESRRGFRFLDVEDTSGEISVLIPKDNRMLNSLYENILLDEVIGIHGRMNNDLFIAMDIVEPELPMNHKATFSEEPVHIALLSDTHVGSYLFLEKEFNNFLEWLNLRGNKKEIAEKVKYLLIAGDLVDGIGIYPNQEKELSIPDIYKQYDFLATLLERVPDYIEIILTMGNHDAVRNAEPQPSLPKDIGGRLYEMDNVHIAGNPVMISTHGVKTLMYHGTSLDTIIGNLTNCTYSRPEVAMIEYLKRRYLIPMYGNDSLSPDKNDYLTIKEIPDIFHSGHIHTNGYANYRGVTIINSGTWQGRTKYQEEQGHIPTPARAPIINLQNHEVSVLHF